MISILLVDDEPIAVETLVFMIKKNFDEIRVAGTARSGKDAIEKAFSLRPDIMVMDINMSGINGLEAMKQIRNMNPLIRFIVISAFDYFDYAIEAASLGVTDYLLKPVKEARFIEVLKKTIQEVDAKRAEMMKQVEQQEKLEMMMPVLETGFINSLNMNDEDPKELVRNFNLLGYESQSGYVMALGFAELKGLRGEPAAKAGTNMERFHQEVKKIVRSACKCIVGPMSLNRIIVYVLDQPFDDSYNQKAAAVKVAKTILDRIPVNYPDAFIGIGRWHSTLVDAKGSYKDALNALNRIASKGASENGFHDIILHAEEITDDSSPTIDTYKRKIEEDFFTKFSDGDELTLRAAFACLYENLKNDPQMNLETIRQCIIELIIGLGKKYDVLDYSIINKLIKSDDEGAFDTLCKDYIHEAIRKIISGRKGKSSSIIQKADQYILDHYAQDISLEEIAKVVNLSSYYFSRFYKEESGINFSDKLVQVRIEKAKELLRNDDLSIKDISYMVGYMEPNYFSKIFKKATGYTASDYKKKMGL